MTHITLVETPRRKPRKFNRNRSQNAPGRKKRKKTIVDLWRLWLVPDKAYRRYKGLRGIYWYWLSRDVRKSEWLRWDKLCLTCALPVEAWEQGQCGHIIPSDGCGEYLRFSRLNLCLQHPGCNANHIQKLASALNAINYDKRYGAGSWQKLYEMRKFNVKEPSQEEYRQLIQSLPSYQEALHKTLSP